MSDRTNETSVSRRTVLVAGAAGAASAAWPGVARASEPASEPASERATQVTGASRGNVKQSVAHWCFDTVGWSVPDTVRAAKSLGCKSVELVAPEDWPLLRENGMTCAIALNNMPGAPFIRGLNNRRYHDEVVGNTKRMIDACGESDGVCRQVIAFTGYKYYDAEDPTSGVISLDEGADNCVTGLRELGEYGAKQGVTISIEQLNTRDDTHPMKGHPGYQGDDLDYVAEIVRRVNLPNVKLLFDIYHVQIMNGDVIRRIRQYHDQIGHVHVAGNPGRAELHLSQEIDYAAVMRALVATGYDGYVGQEFIPTADPMEGLQRAVEICDV